MNGKETYASVLLPLKMREEFSYSIPDSLEEGIAEGCWVKVPLKKREYVGIVTQICSELPEVLKDTRIKSIMQVLDREPVGQLEISFWRKLAEYYMCSVGEVFKAAYGPLIKDATTRKKARKMAGKHTDGCISPLSPAQQAALHSIRDAFSLSRRVLLNGVTGSGKTEIYLHLALEAISAGGQVLYLVPEIAISRQLQSRIEAIFGEQLYVYHSSQTLVEKRFTVSAAREGRPCIILGTRSAVLLPFSNLKLIVVDEEHDQSYKQDDPAPRYNGRDAALMLSGLTEAKIVLGSATPSFESVYNARCGKLREVLLSEKFHNNAVPTIRIIDTNRERRLHNMRGSFSASLIREMNSVLEEGGQILVFRSRRAYSPVVQCTECGSVPKCPNCDVSLSYHKFNNTLLCHYCGYSRLFTTRCPECGETALVDKGAGTEKIEEEIRELFPGRTVERFDAQTTSSKAREEKMIRDFAAHKIDILVGTQMITKGFDFEKLSLVVLLNADSLFAVQDFRSDERSVQLITQLLGRAGRREAAGRMIIQTAQPSHPVLAEGPVSDNLLEERRLFQYPPFVRLITITVKDINEGRLWNACRMISEAIVQCGIASFNGPVVPAVEKIGKEHIREFWIKLPRNNSTAQIKKALSAKIELIELQMKGGTAILPDVDPL